MKVWVLIREWYREYGEMGVEAVGVYNSRAEVVQKISELIPEHRVDMSDVEWEDDYETDSVSYSIWEKGYYEHNHISLLAEEVDFTPLPPNHQ